MKEGGKYGVKYGITNLKTETTETQIRQKKPRNRAKSNTMPEENKLTDENAFKQQLKM